jgi:hypothetical protein
LFAARFEAESSIGLGKPFTAPLVLRFSERFRGLRHISIFSEAVDSLFGSQMGEALFGGRLEVELRGLSRFLSDLFQFSMGVLAEFGLGRADPEEGQLGFTSPVSDEEISESLATFSMCFDRCDCRISTHPNHSLAQGDLSEQFRGLGDILTFSEVKDRSFGGLHLISGPFPIHLTSRVSSEVTSSPPQVSQWTSTMERYLAEWTLEFSVVWPSRGVGTLVFPATFARFRVHGVHWSTPRVVTFRVSFRGGLFYRSPHLGLGGDRLNPLFAFDSNGVSQSSVSGQWRLPFPVETVMSFDSRLNLQLVIESTSDDNPHSGSSPDEAMFPSSA